MFVLSMLARVQIVVEKIAGQHGGQKRRRQAITYLETVKAIARLLLLTTTREMIIGGGHVRICWWKSILRWTGQSFGVLISSAFEYQCNRLALLTCWG